MSPSIPKPEQIAVTEAHLSGAYLPMLQTQAIALARLQAYVEALTAACERQETRIAALVQRVAELEAGPATDEVSAKRKAV